MADVAKIPGIVAGSCAAGIPVRGLPRTSLTECLVIVDVVGNDAISGSVPCPEGQCNGPVEYSMAANKYFALTKEEANVLATDVAKWYAIKAGCVPCE